MTVYYKGHIESVNMLMDRAQSIGVLNDILEASDNRQAHLQIFPIYISLSPSIIFLNSATEGTTFCIMLPKICFPG